MCVSVLSAIPGRKLLSWNIFRHVLKADEVKYLGIHLDRRLTWRTHITTKWKQLDLKLRNQYWIIGPKSQLSLENKLLVYKVILEPVWTYGIQPWGTASNSNLEILEQFQSKVLRIITQATRYVANIIIKRDLQIPTVKQEAWKYGANYWKRLDTHPNNLANTLFQEQFATRRLNENDMKKMGVTWKLNLTEAKDLHIPGSQWKRKPCTYLKTSPGSEEWEQVLRVVESVGLKIHILR